jgi:Skp family chaperone for outer membrane proteins
MRLAIIAAVIAILIGFGAGYLMWGERARQALEERQRVSTELDAMKERQADELRKLREELAAERDRRQRLEEVISQGRK